MEINIENRVLTKQESELVRKYTKVSDYEDIAEELNLKTSKVTHILYRGTKVNDQNKVILENLKKKAFENCKKVASEAVSDSWKINVL